jgi:hypothetical protein
LQEFDRQGNPITLEEFVRLFADESYSRVAATLVGTALVSTVWLGVDHNFYDDGPPLIFETMVFDASHPSWSEEYVDRYPTEESARAGHERVVEALTLRVDESVRTDCERKC